jgi:hypothetical protein
MLRAVVLATVLGCLPLPLFADSNDRWLWVVNDTSREVMTGFHVSDAVGSDWRKDVRGFVVLYPGQRARVLIGGGCWFALRAIFGFLVTVETRNFNVCQRDHWIIPDPVPRPRRRF